MCIVDHQLSDTELTINKAEVSQRVGTRVVALDVGECQRRIGTKAAGNKGDRLTTRHCLYPSGQSGQLLTRFKGGVEGGDERGQIASAVDREGVGEDEVVVRMRKRQSKGVPECVRNCSNGGRIAAEQGGFL